MQWLLILGVLVGALTAARVAARPLARVELRASADSVRVARGPDTVSRIAVESVSAIVSRDPFRIGRKAATSPYDPLQVAEQMTPRPPRPVLTLEGIVDGPEPSAVLEGLPGVDGFRIVRVGDVIAGLQIKQIKKTAVVIVGMDTTWVLEVREPWRN